MSEASIYHPKLELRRRLCNVRGVEYSVNEWGNSEMPLLFYLHGWADTGSTFQFVVDEFLRDWHVVAPDWRGFGRTSHADGSYWFPDYLADLHDILEQYSAHRPVVLVGHSMGGNIGALYAGTMPDRVRAFINIEGFGLKDSTPSEAPARYRHWIESDRNRPRFVSYSNFENLALRIKKRSPAISTAMAEFVAREWGFEHRDGTVHLRADPAHKLPNPILYRRPEAEACWAGIRACTLLVHGKESAFAANIGGLSSISIAGAESVEIDGTGHMLHFEAPGPLAALIEEFLQKTL